MGTYSDDPAYQAYMNNLGFNTAEANRKAADSRASVANTYDFAVEGQEIDRDRVLDNIGYNMENRGITRSGEHERRRAEALRDSVRARGALELSTGGQFAQIEDSLARQLAEMEMQRAAAAMNAAARAGQRSVL